MPDTNGTTITPLKTSTGSNLNITTLQTLTAYTPSVVCWVRPYLRVTAMNGAVATVTVKVRQTTDGVTLYRESVAKDIAADTAITFILPAFLTVVDKAYAVQVLSSNASDTAVAWQCDWLDAGFIAANVTQWLGTALPAESVAGRDAAALGKFLDVATPVFTAASANQTGDCYSSTQRQQMAREAHGVSGTVWHVKYHADEHMSGDGYDGLSWATAYLTAGPGVKTAIEAAAAGDLVLIGAGTFAAGNNTVTIPTGVKVLGAGRNHTILTSTYDGTDFVLTTKSEWNSLTLESLTAGAQPVGNATAAITDAVLRNIRVVGDYDALYVAGTASTIFCYDSQLEAKCDNVAIGGDDHVIKLYNCELNTTGPSAVTPTGASCVSCRMGTVQLFNCRLSVRGATTANVGLHAWNSDGNIYMYGGCITALGVGNLAAKNTAAGVIVLDGVEYDRTKISNTSTGSITDIARVVTDTSGNAYADVKLIKTVDADTAISARVDASATGLAWADGGRLDLILDARAAASTALSNLVWTDAKAGYLTGAVALEATLTAIKGAGWTTETLAAIDVLVDAIKAKTDGLNFTGTDVKATLDGEEVTTSNPANDVSITTKETTVITKD